MRDWLELERLYVVSDLHLGGAKGFQIFGSSTELAWLIDQVTHTPGSGLVALLINGDFVNFLAEFPGVYFDPDGAVTKLDGVIERFAPVFQALKRLLRHPQRMLVVNLGNHDLELALPWVRAHLEDRLANSDVQARGRLLWVTDGTGLRCRVGRTTVVCVHGNEVDSWNIADYERLRRIGRDCQFGRPAEPWTPNAGTQLVIDVMNGIKRDYPFVDLLKPETEGVLPILAALRPGVHRRLLDLAGVAGRKAWDMARMKTGFLEADDEESAAQAFATPWRPATVLSLAGGIDSSPRLRAEVESAWRHQVEPISLVRGVQSQQLGFWSATRDLVTGKPKVEVLREALAYLDCDRSFDIHASDPTFKDLDELIGGDVDLLVAGHTHLERSLPRTRGGGHYFNSGTWAGLIEVPIEVRQSDIEWSNLFKLLAGGSIENLEAAGRVQRRNTLVSVERGASGVVARLCHVEPAKGGKPPELKAVDERLFAGA